MKPTKSLSLAGILIAGTAMGQSISVTNPDNTGPFHDMVVAMTTDVVDLYDSVNFNDFNFTTDGSNGDFIAPAAPFVSLGMDYVFTKVDTNPDAFAIPAGKEIRIGYFGNESEDLNNLSIRDDTGYVESLFQYDIFGGVLPTVGPPQSATIQVAQGYSSALIHFEHTNILTGNTTQSNENRFHFFQGASLDGMPLPVWVIGIDDRENSLIDFDDGFFYLQVVPEPSQLALMAVAGLGLMVLLKTRYRRRRDV